MRRSRKGRENLLLPNIITTMNMLSGFVSCLVAFDGRFELAFYLIILGAFFDLIDGKLARLRESSSKFGLEYDSLADMVTFGLAPSFLLYNMFLANMPIWLKAISFSIPLAVALRLARYNVSQVRKHFKGMPSPVGALIITSLCIILDGKMFFIILPIALLTSALMVGNLKFRSFKDVRLSGSKAVFFWLAISTLFVLFLMKPAVTTLAGATSYSVWCLFSNLKDTEPSRRERVEMRLEGQIEGVRKPN